MARALRIEYKGTFYHVTSRGNERRRIFFSKTDYEQLKLPSASYWERSNSKNNALAVQFNYRQSSVSRSSLGGGERFRGDRK
jgi:REP element-mobilizing transposase RayT